MAKHILRKKQALEFEAAFDKATMERIEAVFTGQPEGVTRRIALGVLTRSKAQLAEKMNPRGAEALLAESESLAEYITRLQEFVKFMQSAQARLLLVLDQYASRAA